MSFIEKINEAIQKMEAQILAHQKELSQLETELQDTKLNPYGVTNIDFTKRNEMLEDGLRMEGALMGLNLAKETYSENEPA